MAVQYPHEDITERIIGVYYEVYNEMGSGYVEKLYHNAMIIALRDAGLRWETQVPTDVWFRNEQVGEFFLDLVVESKIVLELKARKELEEKHSAQILNYLRCTKYEVGLLFNFGPKPEFKRFVYSNDRKKHNPPPKSGE